MATCAYSILKQRVRIVELLTVCPLSPPEGLEDRCEVDSTLRTADFTAYRIPLAAFGNYLAHEEFLVGETGTILLFVVGLHHRRPDQLDWRAQLRCAK